MRERERSEATVCTYNGLSNVYLIAAIQVWRCRKKEKHFFSIFPNMFDSVGLGQANLDCHKNKN
jgi:hypothetical protein